MKKYNSCGDCFLWGRACGEVDCEPEKREDGESVMFEEYSECAKNTEQQLQPDNGKKTCCRWGKTERCEYRPLSCPDCTMPLQVKQMAQKTMQK